MEKLRFRVWDNVNKKMYSPDILYGSEYCIDKDGSILITDCYGISRHSNYNKYKVMQEIMLYQVRIYVGDIVDITIDGYLDIGSSSFDTDGAQTFRGTIVYGNYSFGIEFKDNEFMYLSTIESDEVVGFVVVGNIYENPKMIKEGEL